MESVQHEDNVTCHIWVSFAFLISEHPPYNAFREVDKRATRPIFVSLSLCKDSRFHEIETGIHDVAGIPLTS